MPKNQPDWECTTLGPLKRPIEILMGLWEGHGTIKYYEIELVTGPQPPVRLIRFQLDHCLEQEKICVSAQHHAAATQPAT